LNTTKVFLNCLRCENRNPFRVEEGRRSPYLYVPSSWEEYCKSVSRNRRKYLKSNSQNRLKKASEYSIELIDENSDSNGIFSIIEKISSKSWKNDVGSSISKDERRKSFYRTFTNDGLKKGWVHVWLLKIEGNYVAFEYYLRSRKTYAAIRSDYDKNFAYYHPGENLKIAVLKHMCDDETLDEFDFGGNAAPYKLNWTKKIRKHVNLLIGNRTLLGRSILFSKNYIRPLINVLKS